ncbi:MAG: PatB family C-S lyase [Prevotellaceae bacterium]|jgi:cystathionine beta-lyase|nr:PatB family C-S lyase [Prevotellaceae bacterium]
MKYNFDEIVERRNTNCEKYDKCEAIFGTDDLLPLWVADMDFKVAEPILNVLRTRTEHQIFGYTFQGESYFESIINWQKRRNRWTIKKEWIKHCPGVVPGLNFAVQTLTNEGDKVVIMPPVYSPFFTAATENNRILVENNLKHDGLDYFIDYDDLNEKLKDAAMLIFCNPHNPVGRVWRRDELEKVAELCIKHKTVIVSDEVHSDLIFAPHKHIPIATLSPEIDDLCLTFFAPSKTFNIAGFATAVAVASNENIRNAFWSIIKRLHLTDGNISGTVALEAAYNYGEEWLEQMLEYISENAKAVVDFFEKNIPSIKTKHPESTFLQWIDFSALNLTQNELVNFLIKDAKVGLNDGASFSKTEGTGFMRLNIACSRYIITEALNRILAAYNNLQLR